MSKVMSVTSALAVAMLGAASTAGAQVTSSQDTTYIREAVRGNLLEVALGRLAESRADDDAVEDFAERMVSDHNSMNAQWTSLGRNLGMRFSLDFGPNGQETIDRLEDLSGDEFDQAYMTEMLRHHEMDVAAFQRMASTARSTEVRQLASSGVATIREHLTLAQQVGSRVGVSTTAGRAGGVTTTPTPSPAPVPTPTTDDRTRRTTDREPWYDRDDRDDRNDRDERNDRGDRGALRGEDRAFVQNVLQDHLMHVRLAERAQRDARSDETRRLAEHMEDEFEDWQERWEDLAKRYGVKPPSHLGRLHGEKLERLEQTSRGNVDRVYTRIVVEHLESVVPYFEKEGQDVQPAAVRRLVNEELPVIRKILDGLRDMKEEKRDRPEASERR